MLKEQISSNGLCYSRLGAEQDPLIVMIRGLGSQMTHWPPALLQALVELGYQLLIFDNRDAGRSKQCDHLAGEKLSVAVESAWRGEVVEPAYSLSDMAEDVIGLMDELSIARAHIVGGSMGGMIAQLLAVNYSGRVQSLTLIFTSTLDADLAKGRGWPWLKPVLNRKANLTEQQLLEGMVAHGKWYSGSEHVMTEAELERECHLALQRGNSVDGYARQLLAILAQAPLSELISSIDLPTLILHGDEDPLFGVDCAERLAKCIADSDLQLLSGWGHDLPATMHPWLLRALSSHLQRNS